MAGNQPQPSRGNVVLRAPIAYVRQTLIHLLEKINTSTAVLGGTALGIKNEPKGARGLTQSTHVPVLYPYRPCIALRLRLALIAQYPPSLLLLAQPNNGVLRSSNWWPSRK